jgi:hypothetical protein
VCHRAALNTFEECEFQKLQPLERQTIADLPGVADQHHRRISQTNYEGANMTDNPDAKATTAIKTAIRDFETQFDGGVSFGRFKIAVAPARAFTAIWWTEMFVGGGLLGTLLHFINTMEAAARICRSATW